MRAFDTLKSMAGRGSDGRLPTALLRLYLLFLFGVLGVFAAVSLRWRIVHDSPLMLYVGYLLDLGWVPYVDFFDMNPPGTLFLNWLCYRIIGDSNLGFRALEFLTLGLIAAGAWRYLRPFGSAAALAAPLLFTIHHLALGPQQAFQRELICTVPLALGLAVAFRTPCWSVVRRAVGIGLLAGAIMMIKPQLVAPMPILFLGMLVWDVEADWQRLREVRTLVVPAVACLASTAVAPAVTLLIFAHLGGLDAFLEMARGYWPLYSQLRGDATLQSLPGRVSDLLRASNGLSNFRFIGVAAIGLALGSMAVARATRRARVEFVTLALLGAALLLVVAMAGKLWAYHFIPIWFLLSLGAGLALAKHRDETDAAIAARVVVVALFTLQALYLPPYLSEFVSRQKIAVKSGDVDEIAGFLRANLRSGDLVQPLDVTGGAIHGMFLARAELATPFIYDFHFYHHTDNPYIRQLRDRLTAGMHATCVRYVVEFKNPWRPSGPGTAESFAALEAVLANYVVALDSRNFRILERRPGCVRTK